MLWEMTSPCDDCPFLIKGGIRLRKARVREIARGALDSQGATFSCHKTVNYGGENGEALPETRDEQEQHCAGALIFAEKNGVANQMTRIMERLGLYDARKLKNRELVFGKLGDMLKVSL